MTTISASVGKGGRNLPRDVGIVQTLLNRHVTKLGLAVLKVDNFSGQKTVEAIQTFQRRVMKLNMIDGRVDPNGRTLLALIGTPAVNTAASTKLSGSAWWHANQAKFPNSDSIADLALPFRANVEAFVAALKVAGASVDIASTLRNKKRAYLMHYSWKIAKGLIQPAAVPGETGVDIVWDHGDIAKSKAGAQEMVSSFAIKFQPSLTSLHLSGLAIDMDIDWSATLKIKNKNGQTVEIAGPGTGATNTILHSVGASYGVRKLLSDPPHWSSTGH